MAYTDRIALTTKNGRRAYLPATAATVAKTAKQNASRTDRAPMFSIELGAPYAPGVVVPPNQLTFVAGSWLTPLCAGFASYFEAHLA